MIPDGDTAATDSFDISWLDGLFVTPAEAAQASRAQAKLEKSVDALLTNLASLGRTPSLTRDTYERICQADIRGDNVVLAAVLCELAIDCQPITLRGLFYRAVSAGLFPSTAKEYYNRVGRLVTQLRRRGLIPYTWIVDSLRSTVKPSSWSGLSDFGDTVRRSYRKDFWHHLDDYVHIFVEKDAIAGTIAPVTQEYDVALSPVRGYCSESFAYEIGNQFREIEKPIYCYYLGDFDPSGFDIERDLRAKLEKQSYRRDISWQRLAINVDDFERHNLIPLDVKKLDTRTEKFVDEHGDRCAEVDALDPNELRARVRDAIEQWIPQERWESLKRVEELERETFNKVLSQLSAAT